MTYYLVDDGYNKPKVMIASELRDLSWEYECLDLKDNREFYYNDVECIMNRVECLRTCIYGSIKEVIKNLEEREFIVKEIR